MAVKIVPGGPTAILEAGRHFWMSYEAIGSALGVSKRTVQRWVSHDSIPADFHYQRMAQIVYPKDPALAAKLADHGGVTLAQLGLKGPAGPALTPEQADAVVCAAAEAIDLSPRAVRAGVAAAFRHAQKLGYSVDALVSAFAAARK